MTANHEHTPTTPLDTIWIRNRIAESYALPDVGMQAFDRWLDARDARIEAAAEQRGAIKALREAEEVIDAELQDSPAPNCEEDNYDAGRIDGLTFSQEHLRNRANLEGDDE